MTKAWHALVFALLLVFSAIGPASTQDITGGASVIDGDTIEVHGRRIRLYGIDAPESSQLCVRPNGERWRCGQQAIKSDAPLSIASRVTSIVIAALLLSVLREQKIWIAGWSPAAGPSRIDDTR